MNTDNTTPDPQPDLETELYNFLEKTQTLNPQQQKSLRKILKKPVPNDILWSNIISLMENIGCRIKYRGGSKFSIAKDGAMMFDHRPHGNQASPENVKKIKSFLEKLKAKHDAKEKQEMEKKNDTANNAI